MTKKKLILFGIVAVIVGGLSLYFIFGKEDENKLFVTVDNSLASDKIRIDMGFYSINSGSDKNLMEFGLNKTVYSANKAKSFQTICGENDFLVVYDNQFYTVVRHLIPNDFFDGVPKPHKYNFDFKKDGDKIYLTLNIKGRDGKKIDKELVNVSNAKNNIWASQIEK